jgi:hypothetical protein
MEEDGLLILKALPGLLLSLSPNTRTSQTDVLIGEGADFSGVCINEGSNRLF